MRALAAICCVFLGTVAQAAVQRANVDFQYVRELAARRAAERYRAPEARLPSRIAALTYDDYRKIEFRRDRALWRTDNLPFQVQFFPRGGLYPQRVDFNEFSRTHVQPIPFEAGNFVLGSIQNLRALPDDLGYAGFRILHPINRADAFDEIISFIGASYFRALGAGHHYGLSARGLALDCGIPGKPEEFPRFSEFWLGKPAAGATAVTVYALLESPSATGAFEFIITPGKATFVDTHAALFFRVTDKLPGFAPLTSMFWYGENTSRPDGQMRPEVHDSDGLFIRAKNGEQFWRPLRNPGAPETLEVPVSGLGRFGLVQRDRRMHSYEDREAQYERRPSAWIEPREDWGAGKVRLLELPATMEYGDNIVAYWVPEAAPKPGTAYELSYRIVWASTEPAEPPEARVIATREGIRPGNAKGRLFWIDFADQKSGQRKADAVSVAAEATGGGRIARSVVERYPEISGWRAVLEVEPTDGASTPLELRCRLRDKEQVISETWLYRWKP